MQKTKNVIVLLETAWAHGRGILRGIANYAGIHESWIIHREFHTHSAVIPNLYDLKIDGIILRGSEDPRLKKLLNPRIPAVVVQYNHHFPDHCVITTDDSSIGIAAANHLIERGYRNFGYCGFNDMPWSIERLNYFSKTIAKAGYSCHTFDQTSLPDNLVWKEEQLRLAKWLKKLPKPIGIMACNDDRAQQIVEVSKAIGIAIPEGIALIGVDNDEFVCRLASPTITSVALNTERSGFEAATLLDNMMSGKAKGHYEIEASVSQVVERQSTNIIAIENEQVAMSIKFIRENSQRQIQVEEVAETAMMSRRNLQKKFSEILGMPISVYIRRVRSEKICQALVETNSPVSKIAYDLGFASLENLCRYFKREVGISPQGYRLKRGKI